MMEQQNQHTEDEAIRTAASPDDSPEQARQMPDIETRSSEPRGGSMVIDTVRMLYLVTWNQRLMPIDITNYRRGIPWKGSSP